MQLIHAAICIDRAFVTIRMGRMRGNGRELVSCYAWNASAAYDATAGRGRRGRTPRAVGLGMRVRFSARDRGGPHAS
ncbi:hypothetical protein HMPREF0762_01343 [Slackia exigua ATCC 700122]|uniref:Uncharacterized protein n=1 Tax=Slackia exigua (strain ATCC 700122 / DSM 15923 / CIP 105133 / JCM 11022 / KCTC 5966 / S-7) TaxID=649764 RepID=D0WHM5_SLAES|nr:hypothetical protein HMPREF0762_01343 [Slackia exigua ATCC 700122]